jgi:FKBP12-rapamycin complex-associated protein
LHRHTLIPYTEFSGNSRTKEESIRLLGHLIRSSQRLIKPYSGGILDLLLVKVTDSNQNVASTVLATIGELARVDGEHVAPHLGFLLPLIIDTLQTQGSAAIREVAMRALGQLSRATGTPGLSFIMLLCCNNNMKILFFISLDRKFINNSSSPDLFLCNV